MISASVQQRTRLCHGVFLVRSACMRILHTDAPYIMIEEYHTEHTSSSMQCKDQLAAGCYNGWRGRESTGVYSVVSSAYTIVRMCAHACSVCLTSGQIDVAN
jgi:hypothetical protein